MRRSGADCSVVAGKRGNSRGAKGAGDLRGDRSGSTGNRRNPLVSAEGGSLQGSYEPDKSRGLRPVLREARGAIPRAYSAAERSVPLSRSLLRQCHIDLQRDFEGWMSTPGWGNRSADFLLDKLGPDSYSEVDGSAGHQTRRECLGWRCQWSPAGKCSVAVPATAACHIRFSSFARVQDSGVPPRL